MGTRGKKTPGKASRESDSHSFSTRLNTQQKERLEQAAELLGWTPASLIRHATVEKCAHILNTRSRTAFDFDDLATTLAGQITGPGYEIFDADGNPWIEDHRDVDFEPCPVSVETQRFIDVEQLQLALKWGGSEFLRILVDKIDDLLNPKTLPKPVDPE